MGDPKNGNDWQSLVRAGADNPHDPEHFPGKHFELVFRNQEDGQKFCINLSPAHKRPGYDVHPSEVFFKTAETGSVVIAVNPSDVSQGVAGKSGWYLSDPDNKKFDRFIQPLPPPILILQEMLTLGEGVTLEKGMNSQIVSFLKKFPQRRPAVERFEFTLDGLEEMGTHLKRVKTDMLKAAIDANRNAESAVKLLPHRPENGDLKAAREECTS
jgi:hypothetical protein